MKGKVARVELTKPITDDLLAQCVRILSPLDRYHRQCHAASLVLVRARIFPFARVARGWCRGVAGQHSWVVVGADCYDPRATVVDPTLWSWDEMATEGRTEIWVGRANERSHTPHGGAGDIWEWGRPVLQGGPVIEIDPAAYQELSEEARDFLSMVEPLDWKGWNLLLAQAPVRGWPAGEITRAAYRTRELRTIVPVDRLGMLTDCNPGGMYLP